LRITRILKCLGEFEFNLQQQEFIKFLIGEIFVEKILEPLSDSMTKFWIHTIKADDQREQQIETLKFLLLKQS
jgi:hypothetical protein